MAKKSPFSSKTEEYPERCEAKADGLLLDFCRFIRLQAAQDAWLRRLTRQHTILAQDSSAVVEPCQRCGCC